MMAYMGNEGKGPWILSPSNRYDSEKKKYFPLIAVS